MMKVNSQELATLGYTIKWLEYGILSAEQLKVDLAEFQKDDGDPNIEHYRYRTAMNFLRGKTQWIDEEVEHLLEVVAEDPDGDMSRSVALALLKCDTLTDQQFYKLNEHPAIKVLDVSKAHLRHDLLRFLTRESLAPQVIDRCIQEGDSTVHGRLLEFEDLPIDAVQALSTCGANKAIRNMAAQRLQSKRHRKPDSKR